MSKKKQAQQEVAEETIQSETVKSEENINPSEERSKGRSNKRTYFGSSS